MPVTAPPGCEDPGNEGEGEASAVATWSPLVGEVAEDIAEDNEQEEFDEARETAEYEGMTEEGGAEDLEDAEEACDGDVAEVGLETDAGPCVDCMLGESQAICQTEGCPNQGHRHCDFAP